MRARFPELTNEELHVLALSLPGEVDRQQVRHGAVTELAGRKLLSPRQVCEPALAAEPHPETERFVAAIEARLR